VTKDAVQLEQSELLTKPSFDWKGNVKMKPTKTKVIKAEEIRFVNKSGKAISRPGRYLKDGKDKTLTESELNVLKETYAKKVQRAEREAHQKALSEGISEGKELQKKETMQSIQALSVLIRDLSGLKKNILEAAEEQILQLALAVAEKVIHMETTTNRDVIQNVLRAAMKSIVDRENMKVRVHPQDFQYMLEIKSDFLKNFDGIKNIVFEEDASIARGGAILETMFGEVDARVDQQFNAIKSAMTTAPRGASSQE
jgi:flagellar assembly protein FliH